MDIKNMDVDQLKDLQEQISKQILDVEKEKLDFIKRKDIVKNKTMLSQLEPNDIIFGICFNKDKIFDIGYCNLTHYQEETKYPECCSIGFSHKTKLMGISTSISKNRSNKYYCLLEGYGNEYLFTMFPETLEQDLKEAIEHRIERMKKSLDEDVKKFEKQTKIIFDDISKNIIKEAIQNEK